MAAQLKLVGHSSRDDGPRNDAPHVIAASVDELLRKLERHPYAGIKPMTVRVEVAEAIADGDLARAAEIHDDLATTLATAPRKRTLDILYITAMSALVGLVLLFGVAWPIYGFFSLFFLGLRH